MTAQVTFAVLLLIGSGLMLRSLHALLTADSGVQPDRVATLELTLARADYAPLERRRFYEAVLARLQALPQIDAAAAVNELPLRGAGGVRFMAYPEGQPPAVYSAQSAAQDPRITPDYFQALRITILAGRAPLPRADTLQLAEVAISRHMAARYWPTPRAALGQRLESGLQKLVIVGVVADVRAKALDDDVIAQMYSSLLDVPYDNAAIIARARMPERALLAVLQDAVRHVAPRQAVYNVRMMKDVIAGSIADRRVNTLLLTTFGLLALLLAGIGVYGVMAYNVASRNREIGIRVAIGAEPAQLVWSVLREGMLLTLAGTALGIAIAWWLSRVAASLVYGITAQDLATFVAAPAVLILAGILASFIPARRAAGVDPLRAIRAE